MKTEIIKKIEKKEQMVGSKIKIIKPEMNIDPTVQAQWLIELLNKMYFKHGVSQNIQSVISSIKSGKEKYWFALESRKPVSVVGLINQGDKVEIGRAVSFSETKGVGGLLYLTAALFHEKTSHLPLVAEVRVSDEFKGIPNSIATILLNYKHLHFFPHALIPLFGHGNPYRQEFFLLGADTQISQSKSFLPKEKKVAEFVTKHGFGFAHHYIQNHEVETTKQNGTQKFEVVINEPITVIVPSYKGLNLHTVEKSNQNTGMLIVLELCPQNMSALIHLIENKFIPVGIDSSTSKEGNTILLLHKLRKDVLLAPTVFENIAANNKVSSLFSKQQLQTVKNILKSTRK